MGKTKQTLDEVKRLLCGVVNVQFTPFRSSTHIDEDALRDNTRFMTDNGLVEGRGVLIIGGSVGEGFSLSDEEYRHLVATVVEEADGRIPVCVGCLRPATEPAIRLARYAEAAGADCIMALAPYYYPNEPEDVVYAHFKAIADATDLPIMIYNNLAVTGQDLPIGLLRRLADIDQIVALKECSADPHKLREVAFNLAGRFVLLPSATHRLPFDYQLGAAGFITLFANFCPAYDLALHDACLAQDFSRVQEIYVRSRPLTNYLEAEMEHPTRVIALGKEMCRLAGRPMGEVERLPVVRPSEDERVELRRLMVEVGLL